MLIAQYAQRGGGRKQWEQAPRYNVNKLSRTASHFQVSDWIDEIHTAKGRRDADEADKVYWASTHLDSSLATDWRSHRQLLEKDHLPADQEALFKFVKGEYIEGETQTHQIRDALINARQRSSESPEQFHSRWRALHVRLRNLNYDTDPQEGHMFFRKLLDEIQLRVRSVNPEFLKTATDALKRATLVWDFLRDEHKAQKRKQARSDKYPSKVPRTDSRKEASDTPQRDSWASRPYHTHHTHRPSSNTSSSSTRPNDKEEKPKETGCYRCGKQGHFARGCPTNTENKEKPRSDRRKSQKHSKSHGRSATTQAATVVQQSPSHSRNSSNSSSSSSFSSTRTVRSDVSEDSGN